MPERVSPKRVALGCRGRHREGHIQGARIDEVLRLGQRMLVR